MEDIRKFIKIMEGTIDQTFDNDNIDKHDKVLKRLNKDFEDMFKDRKKSKDDDDVEDVKEADTPYEVGIRITDMEDQLDNLYKIVESMNNAMKEMSNTHKDLLKLIQEQHDNQSDINKSLFDMLKKAVGMIR